MLLFESRTKTVIVIGQLLLNRSECYKFLVNLHFYSLLLLSQISFKSSSLIPSYVSKYTLGFSNRASLFIPSEGARKLTLAEKLS